MGYEPVVLIRPLSAPPRRVMSPDAQQILTTLDAATSRLSLATWLNNGIRRARTNVDDAVQATCGGHCNNRVAAGSYSITLAMFYPTFVLGQ